MKITGDYLLRLKLSGLRPEGGRAPRLKVYLSNVDRTLIEQDVDAADDKPITIEKRVHLLAGNYPVRLINSVPGTESRRLFSMPAAHSAMAQVLQPRGADDDPTQRLGQVCQRFH